MAHAMPLHALAQQDTLRCLGFKLVSSFDATSLFDQASCGRTFTIGVQAIQWLLEPVYCPTSHLLPLPRVLSLPLLQQHHLLPHLQQQIRQAGPVRHLAADVLNAIAAVNTRQGLQTYQAGQLLLATYAQQILEREGISTSKATGPQEDHAQACDKDLPPAKRPRMPPHSNGAGWAPEGLRQGCPAPSPPGATCRQHMGNLPAQAAPAVQKPSQCGAGGHEQQQEAAAAPAPASPQVQQQGQQQQGQQAEEAGAAAAAAPVTRAADSALQQLCTSLDPAAVDWAQLTEALLQHDVSSTVLQELPDDAVLLAVQHLVTTSTPLAHAAAVLATLLLPRLQALTSTASVTLISTVVAAAEAHPRGLLQGLLQPLLCSPELGTQQGQLVAKVAKQLRGSSHSSSLLQWLCQVLRTSAAAWHEPHVAVASALLDCKLELDGSQLEGLVQAVATAAAVSAELQASLAFAKLCMTLVTQHGASMSREQLGVLQQAVARTKVFLTKAVMGRIQKLLL